MINKKIFIVILAVCLSIAMTSCSKNDIVLDSEEQIEEELDLTLIEKYRFLILENEQNGKQTVTIESKDGIKKINDYLEPFVVITKSAEHPDGQTTSIPKGTVDIFLSDNRSLYFEIEQYNDMLFFISHGKSASFESKSYTDLFTLVLECAQ